MKNGEDVIVGSHSRRRQCHLPKCTKECIKTYKSTFKLYKLCRYRLYKVCPWCGHEFDYYFYHICPCCGDNPDGATDGLFIFFPELEVETSPSRLFPELFFYP